MANTDISLLEIDIVEFDEDQIEPPPTSNVADVWQLATRLVGKSLQTAEEAVARRSADLVGFDQKLEALQTSKSKAAQSTLPRLLSRRAELEEEIQSLRTHLSDFLFLSDAMGQLHREALVREELQIEALAQIKRMTVDLGNARSEAAAVRRAADKAGKKNALLHDQVHQLERGNAHLQDHIRHLEEQLEEAKTSGVEVAKRAAEQQLATAERRMRTLEAENAAFRKTIEEMTPLRAELEGLRTRHKRLEGELQTHRVAVSELQQECTVLRQLVAEKDASVAELQALVEVLSGGEVAAEVAATAPKGNVAPAPADLGFDLPPSSSDDDPDITMLDLRVMKLEVDAESVDEGAGDDEPVQERPPPLPSVRASAPAPLPALLESDSLLDDLFSDASPIVDAASPPPAPVEVASAPGPIALPGNANVDVDLDLDDDLVVEESAEVLSMPTDLFDAGIFNTAELDALASLELPPLPDDAVVVATEQLVQHRAGDRVEVKLSGILLHQAYTVEEIVKLAQLDESDVRRTLARYIELGLATKR